MSDGTVAESGRPEPPTRLMQIPAPDVAHAEPPAPPVIETAADPTPAEPPTRVPESATEPAGTEPAGTESAGTAPASETVDGAGAAEAAEAGRPEPATTGSVWPGLTAAGLPTRVPRQATDEESLKQAFFQSWEAPPTSPTPLTRPPFTPTYLDEPPRPRTPWAQEMGSEPKEPPQPPEPPDPKEPPEPKEPPAPPTPEPSPTPFPSPTPVPTPPHPVPPTPLPTPPIPPGPPVPTPPAPFPPPPGPVPPPPAIVPGSAARRPAGVTPGVRVYQGGNYSELETEPITGMGTLPAEADRSGSLTGHLISREVRERRERRRRLRTVVWVSAALVLFGAFIAAVVVVLAGDFIGGLFDTFSRVAG